MIDQEDAEKWELDAKTAIEADDLWALVERAARIIKQQGDALDQAHARELRDEALIADLRHHHLTTAIGALHAVVLRDGSRGLHDDEMERALDLAGAFAARPEDFGKGVVR